ncbi:MAG: tripartite tricarboxylate transporter substrate binding protein [Burkholderiales bacterium]
MKSIFLAMVFPALLCGLAKQAASQSYPTRAVTFIVPFTPGTGIDIIARAFGQQLTQRWGQAFIIDNRAGASGNIGAEMVANAKPDGYTLMVTATSLVTNAAINKNPRYDPLKSFEAVSLVATGTMSLLISNGTQASSVKELVALAKQRPGELNYASSGNGTPQHLSMELLKLEAGVDLTHIPFKGTAPAITDTVAGRVNAMFMPIHTALPFLQRNQLRMLAVLAIERSPVVPNVPTMREAGFPSIQVENWYGVMAPGGTPAELVAKLNGEINAMLKTPETNSMLSSQGLQPVGGAPSRLTELIKSEQQRWPRVVAAAKIGAD